MSELKDGAHRDLLHPMLCLAKAALHCLRRSFGSWLGSPSPCELVCRSLYKELQLLNKSESLHKTPRSSCREIVVQLRHLLMGWLLPSWRQADGGGDVNIIRRIRLLTANHTTAAARFTIAATTPTTTSFRNYCSACSASSTTTTTTTSRRLRT